MHHPRPVFRRRPASIGRRVLFLMMATAATVAMQFGAKAQVGWVEGPTPPTVSPSVIAQVEAMVRDSDLQRRAQQVGLNVVNVMWEDTGRYQGSSVGPNISDLTLQVMDQNERSHLLPVFRFPNFSDRTADVRARDVWVRVGNARGGRLRPVRLPQVLRNLRRYLSVPRSLIGEDDFTASRDSHYLVSAQHVFVPLEAQGRIEFNPVLYNYQSMPESPAVMTLLVSRQGTSITIIENRAEDRSQQGWGQQLFHNDDGQRTRFTAERRSAVAQRIASGRAEEQDQGALEEGADMVMIVQVPLRHRNRGRGAFFGGADDAMAPMESGAAPPPMAARRSSSRRSDVENAVIGHGDAMGAFTEMRRLRLVRDDRFPVRVTVQFYRATSNGVVSDEDLREVRDQIERVYEEGDYVGSLVVPRGDRNRPTNWTRRRCPRGRRCGPSIPTPVLPTPVPAPVVAPESKIGPGIVECEG